MNPLHEVALWATPALLAIIGFFFQRELSKQDKKFEECFRYLREEMPRQYVSKGECGSCKELSHERRDHCKEVVDKMEKNISGLADQMDELDDCIKTVGNLKC